MKAISLWQPWATAIALGSKTIETRGWPTRYRGPIAIHAAKRLSKPEMRFLATQRYWQAALAQIGFGRPGEDSEPWDVMPFGALVATAQLTDCLPTESIDLIDTHQTHALTTGHHWTERLMGDFSPGRYGWILENIKPLAPIPYRGAQGLFEVPDHLFQTHTDGSQQIGARLVWHNTDPKIGCVGYYDRTGYLGRTRPSYHATQPLRPSQPKPYFHGQG